MDAGKAATFSRTRYIDSYSVEDTDGASRGWAATTGMAIGNTIDEDPNKKRGDASFYQYEYVMPGTHFPFITVIKNPTLLDIAGLLQAIDAADEQGYGKYSANNGKFSTEILAVSTGHAALLGPGHAGVGRREGRGRDRCP